MALHGFAGAPFWLAAAGVLTAGCSSCTARNGPTPLRACWRPIRNLLLNKYYFDWFNENVLSRAGAWPRLHTVEGRRPGVDRRVLVNGSAATVSWFGSILRRVQNGYLYAYAFWMVIGLAVHAGLVPRAVVSYGGH